MLCGLVRSAPAWAQSRAKCGIAAGHDVKLDHSTVTISCVDDETKDLAKGALRASRRALQAASGQVCPLGQHKEHKDDRCCEVGQLPSGDTCCPIDQTWRGSKCEPLTQEELCVHHGSALACLELAERAVQAQDYERARSLASLACERSNRGGCGLQARLAFVAKGLQDRESACSVLESTCRESDVASCGELGRQRLLATCPGAQPAGELLERACLAGNQEFCAEIALELINSTSADRLAIPIHRAIDDAGRSCDTSPRGIEGCYAAGVAQVSLFLAKKVEGSLDGAADQLEKACKQDIARACTWRGMLFWSAIGVAKDQQRALIAFGRACDLADHDGCSSLADMYVLGHLVQRDSERAKRYYKFACAGDNAHACYMYGIATEDVTEAHTFLRRACDIGHELACVRGTILEFHISEVGQATALGDLRRSCASATDETARATACDFVDGYQRRWAPRVRPSTQTYLIYLSGLHGQSHDYVGFSVSGQRSTLEWGLGDLFSSKLRALGWAGVRLASWPDVGLRKLSLVNLSAGVIGAIENRYSAGWDTIEANLGVYLSNTLYTSCLGSAQVQLSRPLVGYEQAVTFLFSVGVGYAFRTEPYHDRCFER